MVVSVKMENLNEFGGFPVCWEKKGDLVLRECFCRNQILKHLISLHTENLKENTHKKTSKNTHCTRLQGKDRQQATVMWFSLRSTLAARSNV